MCTKRVLKCTECYSYVVCAHAKHSHRTQYILYSIKVCIRSVKIFFLFLLLFLSFFLSLSLSLLASLDLFHLIGLVLCQVTRREKKEKEEEEEEDQ